MKGRWWLAAFTLNNNTRDCFGRIMSHALRHKELLVRKTHLNKQTVICQVIFFVQSTIRNGSRWEWTPYFYLTYLFIFVAIKYEHDRSSKQEKVPFIFSMRELVLSIIYKPLKLDLMDRTIFFFNKYYFFKTGEKLHYPWACKISTNHRSRDHFRQSLKQLK